MDEDRSGMERNRSHGFQPFTHQQCIFRRWKDGLGTRDGMARMGTNRTCAHFLAFDTFIVLYSQPAQLYDKKKPGE